MRRAVETAATKARSVPSDTKIGHFCVGESVLRPRRRTLRLCSSAKRDKKSPVGSGSNLGYLTNSPYAADPFSGTERTRVGDFCIQKIGLASFGRSMQKQPPVSEGHEAEGCPGGYVVYLPSIDGYVLCLTSCGRWANGKSPPA